MERTTSYQKITSCAHQGILVTQTTLVVHIFTKPQELNLYQDKGQSNLPLQKLKMLSTKMLTAPLQICMIPLSPTVPPFFNHRYKIIIYLTSFPKLKYRVPLNLSHLRNSSLANSLQSQELTLMNQLNLCKTKRMTLISFRNELI